MQKRGWNIKDMEQGNSGMNTTSDGVTEIFGKSAESQGVGLSQLALLSATLTDLVQKEAARNLENVYTALHLSTTSRISKKEAEAAFKGYLVMYLLGDSTEGVLREDLVAAERDLVDIYPAWRSVKLWAKDLDQTLAFTQAPRRNPFRDGE